MSKAGKFVILELSLGDFVFIDRSYRRSIKYRLRDDLYQYESTDFEMAVFEDRTIAEKVAWQMAEERTNLQFVVVRIPELGMKVQKEYRTVKIYDVK